MDSFGEVFDGTYGKLVGEFTLEEIISDLKESVKRINKYPNITDSGNIIRFISTFQMYMKLAKRLVMEKRNDRSIGSYRDPVMNYDVPDKLFYINDIIYNISTTNLLTKNIYSIVNNKSSKGIIDRLSPRGRNNGDIDIVYKASKSSLLARAILMRSLELALIDITKYH